MASAFEVWVFLGGPGPNCEDAGSAEHSAPGKEPTELPVGEPEFGLVEGVLSVDPSGEPVADERGVNGGEEPIVFRDPRSPARRRTAVTSG